MIVDGSLTIVELTQRQGLTIGDAVASRAFALWLTRSTRNEEGKPVVQTLADLQFATGSLGSVGYLGLVAPQELDEARRHDVATNGSTRCVRCGCTDMLACEGGCSWSTLDPATCTRCAGDLPAELAPRTQPPVALHA